MNGTAWDVILRDDDITTPDVIAYALVRVLGMTPADALAVTCAATTTVRRGWRRSARHNTRTTS
ncbi:ATP-dependent Clp protease adaptor ClpS [Saccharothrix deserti]|uniref:ATP-dependent Clp protease adaptor ClpS n=1 Tax=Saccharothrix deserti TaxID=2593674 RepID=UPI00131D2A53|nr:ATP-dependent Clp protease adaptor ClpS [Saccharothrix deserti]